MDRRHQNPGRPPSGKPRRVRVMSLCHNFTRAVISLTCADAYVRVDGAGNVAHSVAVVRGRVIDETGAIAMDDLPGMAWRLATVQEIDRMVVGDWRRQLATARKILRAA